MTDDEAWNDLVAERQGERRANLAAYAGSFWAAGHVTFTVELAASVTTIAGMIAGSTTRPGAIWYLVSSAFWFAFIWRRKAWGLLPLTMAAAGVALGNLLTHA